MTAPKVYSITDALAPMPPVRWIAQGLFAEASTSVTFGAPGAKKTWSMLDLAVCVALGCDWLGHPTEQSSVLLIDEESGPRRLLRRIGDVARGHLADPTLPIFATSLHGFNFFAPGADGGPQELERLIKLYKVRFVVIDALADVMLGGDENAVKDTQKVFHALRSVAEATGAAINLIHHANKVKGYRGSTAIAGAIDLLLQVESEPSKAVVKFETAKARDTEPAKFAGECHWTASEFWMTEATAPSTSTLKYTPAMKHVITMLATVNNRATVKEVETLCADKYAGQTARNALYELARAGIVNLVAGGNGAAATYEVDPLAIGSNPVM